MIKNSYLGQSLGPDKKKRTFHKSNKPTFMFEWDNEEDTSNTLLAIKKVIKPPGLY